LCEQWHGLGDSSRQGIGQSHVGSDPGQEELGIRRTALRQGTFEYGQGVREIPLAQGQRTLPRLRKDGAAQVRRLLGKANSFCGAGAPLSKLPALCQAVREPAPRPHGGHHHAGARMAQRALEDREGLPEHVDGATVVLQGEAIRAVVAERSRLLEGIPTRRGRARWA
jgi:hypothetical protein